MTTATATQTKHVYTGYELWRAVAAFQISLDTPRLNAGRWVAWYVGDAGRGG